jgi:hypothetical protein
MAIDPAAALALLTAYGGWQGETRRKHRAQVLGRLGWRWCGSGERKLLDEFMLARALERDAPPVLLQLACELAARRTDRPQLSGAWARVARTVPASWRLRSGGSVGGRVRLSLRWRHRLRARHARRAG